MDHKPDQTFVDLLRHGEPVGGRRYRGQIDDPLSDKGWSQMREAIQAGDRWDSLVSSPLKRCAEFAGELAVQRSIPLRLDDRFKEIGFGAWEGRTADELRSADPGCVDRFLRDPFGFRPEGAEPLERFAARVTDGWRDVLEGSYGRRILIVGHAGIIRMLIAHVLGIPLNNLFRIQVGNAGMTRIRIDGQGTAAMPVLVFHGR